MVTFFGIIIATGFVMLFGSMIFGHDHDGAIDHDGDHGDDGHSEGSISIFSFKIIGSFLIGFGASAILAVYQLQLNNFQASLVGVLFGVVIGAVSWWLLTLINKQQANSLLTSASAVGLTASVTLGIDANPGEVAFSNNGTFTTRSARSVDNVVINKGEIVKIINIVGNDVLVERIKK